MAKEIVNDAVIVARRVVIDAPATAAFYAAFGAVIAVGAVAGSIVGKAIVGKPAQPNK